LLQAIKHGNVETYIISISVDKIGGAAVILIVVEEAECCRAAFVAVA